jgi:hypothetical protein
MAIDTSGGGRRRRASAFEGSDGQRFVLVIDGDEWQLWWRWTIEIVFNGGDGGGV